MTILRPMTNDDLLKYERLCSICYTYTAKNPPESLPEEKLRIRMGVFDEEGKLLSAMMQIPYKVRFGGETVPLVGIGGVVTDPAARGQRAVRQLFEEGLPRLYREGYVFSVLYPFSHRFYRKFGYESAEVCRFAKLPRASLKDELRPAEEIVRVLPEEEDAGMREIYEAYALDKQLPVLRDDEMWRDLRKGTPWENLKHAYVLRVDGQPAGYWIGTMRKDNWHCTLTIQDMAWTSFRGLEAIFAMMRGMNEIETIEMRVQGGFDPRRLVKEPYDVSWGGCSDAMVRVMNVPRALELQAVPPVAGSLCISVTDEQIPENCGSFFVQGDGQRLTVMRTEAEPDIVCTIQGLSVMAAGGVPLAEAVENELITVQRAENLLFGKLLFPGMKLHMNQDF